jgi:hypothetical protein
MSNNNSSLKNEGAVATTPDTVLTPEALVEQLRVLRSQIPEYTHLPTADARTLRRAANASPELVQASINTVGASPELVGAMGRSSDDLQSETEQASRWTAAEDELRAFLQGVSATNLVRKHRIGLTALQVYSMTRQLVRQKEHAALLPHLDLMKQANKFGKKRKVVAPAPPAAPVPTPAPSTPSAPKAPNTQ